MEEFKYRNGEEKGQEPNAGKSPCSQGSPCQYISITVLVQSSSMSISTFSCDRPVRLICGFYYKIQEVPGTYFTGLYWTLLGPFLYLTGCRVGPHFFSVFLQTSSPDFSPDYCLFCLFEPLWNLCISNSILNALIHYLHPINLYGWEYLIHFLLVLLRAK